MRVARKQPVPVRALRDPLDEVIEAVTAAPDDAYWSRRLVDLVRDPMTAWLYRTHLAQAVRTWIERDVAFFIHEGYLSEQLAVWAWPREVFDELEVTLRLEAPSLTHLVLGRLWLEARRSPEDVPEFYANAARHLRKVSPGYQIGAWSESLCEALAVVDTKELARRANEILERASDARHERTLLAILRGAARAGAWDLYDAHRRSYAPLGPDGGLAPNGEIAELDMQRAERNMFGSYIPPVFEEDELGEEVTSLRQARGFVSQAKTVIPPARLR